MLKNMVNRTKYVLGGEEGGLDTQMGVLVTVALLVATIIFAFKDKIGGMFDKAGGVVEDMGDDISNVDTGEYK